MAISAKGNPKVVHGKLNVQSHRATDTQTWKAGEFCYATSGAYSPVANDGVNIDGQFMQDQTASTSSSDVWVGVIPSSSVIFEGYTCSATSDAAVARTNKNIPYALTVSSNQHMIDVSDTGHDAVVITDVAWDYEPFKNSSTDSPGKCKFYVLTAALEA